MAGTIEDYKKMIDQDYYVNPLSDYQEGEKAGVETYNQMVEPVNQLMKSGEPLRRMYTPEQEQRINSDKAEYEKGQLSRENMSPIDRNPAGEQNFIEDLLLGKKVEEIPMLPSLQTPSQPVRQANIPMLTDIAVSNRSVNVPNVKPESTAPQITSEEQIAQGVNDTGEYLNANVKGAPVFTEMVKAGEEARMKADEAKAVIETKALQAQKKAIEDALEESQQAEARARTRAEEQTAQLGSIDPNRVWNNRAVWSKMALIAGAAISGRGGSTSGLQMMQDMVANDIKAQEADLAAGVKRQGSLLELLKPYANNRIELIKLANSVGMKMAEKYGDAMKANVGQGAIPALAAEKTMKEYLKPLLVEKNKNDETKLKMSGQEQNRRYNDEQLKQKNLELQLAKARLKFDKGNMSESDAKRLEGATAMAISAKRMKQLEDDKNFDPTAIKNAISSYMQGKGIPGSLNEQQAEYVANYANYFSYKRQALTGAAASDKEEERIKLLVAPDKTFRKDAIKLYQGVRARDINGAINSMNAPALERTKNIPEFAEFAVNRAEANKAKLKSYKKGN